MTDLRLRAPFGYIGGKSKMARWIVKWFPNHRVYCEPFAGSAAVLFAKPRSEEEAIADKDEGIVNFFLALRDSGEQLVEWLQWTPYSREVFQEAVRRRFDAAVPPGERAYYWYVAMKQSFGGDALRPSPTWGYTVRTARCGMAISCRHFIASVELLPRLSERLQRVSIECADWRDTIDKYDSETALFYLDPPYHPATRKSGGYFHEMSAADHQSLVQRLLVLRGKAVLSGYEHADYAVLEQSGRRRVDYATACRVVGHTRWTKITGRGSGHRAAPRVESIWISPSCFEEVIPCV